ncbi:MAG: calcium-binding protein [Nocardioides sp.]
MTRPAPAPSVERQSARMEPSMRMSVLALVSALVMSGSGSPHASHLVAVGASLCFGSDATIVGTDASETINGTQGNDVIVGGGGDDTINGLGGDDRICDPSGPGNDNRLRGGSGNDRIRGSSSLSGGAGNDVLDVAGTVGSSVLVDGGAGNDTLRARALKAVFVPGPGRDRVIGNSVPNDEVSYPTSRDGVVVDLATGLATGQGRDRITRVDYVTGSRHADVLRGDGAHNLLSGLGGGDVLTGRGGPDLLNGGPGADSMNGGPGQDSCDGGASDRRVSCESRL